jgi:hypothetical protein
MAPIISWVDHFFAHCLALRSFSAFPWLGWFQPNATIPDVKFNASPFKRGMHGGYCSFVQAEPGLEAGNRAGGDFRHRGQLSHADAKRGAGHSALGRRHKLVP